MITLRELARELGATELEVATFGNLDDWHPDYLVPADDVTAIREAWDMAPEPEPEPVQCRRVTAEGAREVLDAGGAVRRDDRYSGEYRYIVTREPNA